MSTREPRGAGHAWRLPAGEIERFVSEAVRSLTKNPTELARCAHEAGVEHDRIRALLENANRWDGNPLEAIDRVDLGPEKVAILISLRDLFPGEVRLRHTVPMTMRRRGVESRLVLGSGRDATGLGPALVKAIARGRRWFEDLVSGRAASLVEIAKAEGITESYVGRLIPLAFLAPDRSRRLSSASTAGRSRRPRASGTGFLFRLAHCGEATAETRTTWRRGRDSNPR